MIRALPFVLLATPALALPEGRFEATTEGGSGTVTIAGDTFAIEVGAPGCAGDGHGTWKAGEPGSFRVTLAPPDPALAACTLEITEKDGAYLMREEGCLGYHGAACGFGGTFEPARPAE